MRQCGARGNGQSLPRLLALATATLLGKAAPFEALQGSVASISAALRTAKAAQLQGGESRCFRVIPFSWGLVGNLLSFHNVTSSPSV